jgi:DNA-binding NarL/FixJ family response regulator
VLVLSRQHLIRDAVRTALRSLGFATGSLGVPVGPGQFREVRRSIARVEPDVGLLVADLDDAAQLREAMSVVAGLDLTWVVLTTTGPGAVWGAVLEAGAAAIVPTSTKLQDLEKMLRRTAREVPEPDDDQLRLLDAWRSVGEDQRALTHRLEALSSREMEILVELHEGNSVKVIAARAGVAEGTVRSQVKAVLNKLEVSSQLQAVASYRHVNAWVQA